MEMSKGIPVTGAVDGPLTGLRILELGHFVAAPFATRVLADLGADVIKVEPPGKGDPVRSWGAQVDGHSLWFSVHGRNKRCVTINLKSAKGIALVKDLIAQSDAVVENFKPGQLERFGIGPDVIDQIRPGCIVTRISGYGQTGPRRDQAAFGVIGEAIGGLRFLTAHPSDVSSLPPVRTGVSLGDMVAGLYACIGLLAGLLERKNKLAQMSDKPQPGRIVDVALTEAVFSLLEGCLPEYGKLGAIRQPTGSTLPTTAPSNAYKCQGGEWILIGANSGPLFEKLVHLMGRPELLEDSRFQGNQNRVENSKALDAAIGEWTAGLEIVEAEQALKDANIPSTRLYTIEDCAADEQFRSRGMVTAVQDPMFTDDILHPGVVPAFDEGGAQGGIGWAGPDVGHHNEEVFQALANLDLDDIKRLRVEGVI